MKLTQDQIQELYKFTRAHYVEHYDLQTELVDHLANGIEQQWAHSPKLSFDEAKQMEFKKFGVFGFMDVVAERQKAMGKKYRKIIWRFFKEWFQLPKILIMFLVIVIISVLLYNSTDEEWKQGIVLGLSSVLALGALGYFFITRKNRELDMIKGGKKWMLGEMIFQFGGITQLSNFSLQLGLSTIHAEGFILNNIWFDVSFAIVWTSVALVSYVAMFVIPSKGEELLAETYPEYKITQNL